MSSPQHFEIEQFPTKIYIFRKNQKYRKITISGINLKPLQIKYANFLRQKFTYYSHLKLYEWESKKMQNDFLDS